MKGCSLEELSSAIHNVLAGGACFNPNVAGKVTQFFSQMANSNGEFNFEHGEDEHIDLSVQNVRSLPKLVMVIQIRKLHKN